jgi:hypothetical protein
MQLSENNFFNLQGKQNPTFVLHPNLQKKKLTRVTINLCSMMRSISNFPIEKLGANTVSCMGYLWCICLNQKQKAKSKTAEQKGEQTVQDSHSDMLGSKSRGDITTSPHLLAFYKTVDLIKLCRPEKKWIQQFCRISPFLRTKKLDPCHINTHKEKPFQFEVICERSEP